jgi:dTDP-4-dehydrorhamnose reductase
MFLPPGGIPLPLLITGITGVAGFNALPYFRALAPDQIIGIRPVKTWGLQGPGIVPVDAEDRAGLWELFRRHRFRAVLNCAGNCALKSCELDPAMARRLNVDSAVNLAELTASFGARLVHLSTDLVFSGKEGTGGYGETDAVDPVTVYGKTMAEGEEVVARLNPAAAILRISLPMGPSFSGHAGAIDWIQSRFRAGRPATLYFDEVRSCAYVDDLNRVFRWFLGSTTAGLYHLGGPRPLTLYQIAQVVNRVGGYDPTLLKGCPRRDAGPMPPRAGNVSMNSERLWSLLGFCPLRPWPLGKDLHPGDERWHFERKGDAPGSLAKLEAWLYRYPSATYYAGKEEDQPRSRENKRLHHG